MGGERQSEDGIDLLSFPCGTTKRGLGSPDWHVSMVHTASFENSSGWYCPGHDGEMTEQTDCGTKQPSPVCVCVWLPGRVGVGHTTDVDHTAGIQTPWNARLEGHGLWTNMSNTIL